MRNGCSDELVREGKRCPECDDAMYSTVALFGEDELPAFICNACGYAEPKFERGEMKPKDKKPPMKPPMCWRCGRDMDRTEPMKHRKRFIGDLFRGTERQKDHATVYVNVDGDPERIAEAVRAFFARLNALTTTPGTSVVQIDMVDGQMSRRLGDDEYELILRSYEVRHKIPIIKYLRGALYMSLKEAHDVVVESHILPSRITKGTRAHCEVVGARLQSFGCHTELRQGGARIKTFY